LLTLFLAIGVASAATAIGPDGLAAIVGGWANNTAICQDVWCLGVSSDIPCGPFPGCDCYMYAQWVTEVASPTGGNDINAGTANCCSKWDCDTNYLEKTCTKTSTRCGVPEGHPEWAWGGTYTRCVWQ
jgi:hypothetical protein